MRKHVSVLLLAPFIFSCTTIFHSKKTLFEVRSDQPLMVEVTVPSGEALSSRASFYGLDPMAPYTARFDVIRNRKQLSVVIVCDSVKLSHTVKSRIESLFWLNVLSGGVGFLPDITNPKRFYYPSLIVGEQEGEMSFAFEPQIKKKRDRRSDKTVELNRRGRFLLTFGFPTLNIFYRSPDITSRYVYNTGFLGVSAGADYRYSDKKSLSAEINAIMDFIVPFPAPYDREGGYYEDHNQVNIQLCDNFNHRYFSIGYGVNLSRNKWRVTYSARDRYFPEIIFPAGARSFLESTDTQPNRTVYWAIGPNLNAYWRVSPICMFGANYRPTVYRFIQSERWKYEHSISIDFKLMLNPGRRIKLN